MASPELVIVFPTLPPELVLILLVSAWKSTMIAAVHHLLRMRGIKRLRSSASPPATVPDDRLPLVFALAAGGLPVLLANPLLWRTAAWAPLVAAAVEGVAALGVLLAAVARDHALYRDAAAQRERRQAGGLLVALLVLLFLYQLQVPQLSAVCALRFPARPWTENDAGLWVFFWAGDCFFASGATILFAEAREWEARARWHAVQQRCTTAAAPVGAVPVGLDGQGIHTTFDSYGHYSGIWISRHVPAGSVISVRF